MSGVLSPFGSNVSPFALNFPPPAQLGIIAESFSNLIAQAQSGALVSGTIYLIRVPLPGVAVPITNVLLAVGTAGVTLTAGQNFTGLFDNNGNQIGISADQSVAWAGTGFKTAALAGGPFTSSAPFGYVPVLANGTTPPLFMRAAGSLIGSQLANLNAAGSNLPFAINGTVATVLPGNFAYGGNVSANAFSIWAGLS